MGKFLKNILIVGASLISFSILFSLIKMQISSVIIVVILGLINYVFEAFAEAELNSGMNFFNKLSRQAHHVVYKLWDLAKKLVLLLLMQFIGIDLLSSYLDIAQNTERTVLFQGALLVGGMAAILTGISVSIKLLNEKQSIEYRNKKYSIKISIPNYWKKINTPKESNVIMAFDDKMSDKICYIHADEKINYDESATLDDFALWHLEGFKTLEDFELLSINKIDDIDKSYYEIPILIMKKKYSAYMSFWEDAKNYYAVRVILPDKERGINEHQKIIKSLQVAM